MWRKRKPSVGAWDWSNMEPGGVQMVLFSVLFSSLGHLAKIDGRVTESEIEVTRGLMQRMGLSDSMKREAMRLFTVGKDRQFPIETGLRDLRAKTWDAPVLVHYYVEIMLQLAYCDGKLNEAERLFIEYVCEFLGVSKLTLSRLELKVRYFTQSNKEKNHAEEPKETPYTSQPQGRYDHQAESALKTLKITRSATNAEIKLAYRQLMMRHHPDKFIASGASEREIQQAAERTGEIKAAYEYLRRDRGF